MSFQLVLSSNEKQHKLEAYATEEQSGPATFAADLLFCFYPLVRKLETDVQLHAAVEDIVMVHSMLVG